MCVTAVLAGASLLMGAVNTATQIGANNANKKMVKWQSRERAKEIKEDADLRRIAAMEQENERARQFNRGFSSSMAAIGASGIAEHLSFFQGVDPDNREQLGKDTRAIRLGLVTGDVAGEREIQAGGYAARVAGFNAKMSNIGAVADFMADAMNMASSYGGNATPKGGGDSSEIKVNMGNRYTNAAWSRSINGRG